MMNFITKLFGTKSSRELKKLQPYVEKINKQYESFHKLSNEDLRKETKDLKKYLNDKLSDIQNKIDTM